MKKKLALYLFGVFFLLGVVSALNLQVHFPVDGETYNSRSLHFDLTANEYSDFFFLKDSSDVSGHWRRLCRSEMECEKRVRVSEGQNDVAVRAISESDMKTKEISFFVDSKDPRINRVYPRRNSFVNEDSNFTVAYSEDNVKKVKLYYWFNGETKTVQKGNCPSGRRVECVFDFPEDIEGDGEMFYWFEIIDDADNVDVSRETEVYVDKTKPQLLDFSHEIDRRRVDFVIEMEEDNLDEIFYIDESEMNPREKRLCSRLRYGRCTARKNFRPGVHVLDIKAVDKAGNVRTIANNLEIPI